MAGAQVVEVDGHRLRLSNLDKVIYPETGTTKGEVIAHYTRVAPWMLPHLRDRPITRIRWPEGTGHEPFYAKALEAGAPEWIRRAPIDHSAGAKDYPIADNLATLVYLAQVASLELHVPQWRFGPHAQRQNPDRLVIDLDPGEGTGLAECAEVARLTREILRDLGMDPVPVTSGSKGLHLYAPLDGTRTSEEISAVARELARLLEADHPDLIVSNMAKAARNGKVLFDWSQNNGSKTTIAPYSLRGRDRPMVATPRTWDELDDPDLRQLDIDEVAERLAAQREDPLAALAPVHLTQPLAAYRAKRDAARTPEPVPDTAAPAIVAAGQPLRFVIQEHHASRLHYDLRLERDGVLVSWAVPRGVPETTERNNLAVMTEPHPLDYLTFHGTIPAGEYGAGTMTIWDSGTYAAEKWRDDEVIFTATGADGGPLGTARLALIRTDGEGESSTWLLHRMKTAGAEPRSIRTPRADAGAATSAPPANSSPMLAAAATPQSARVAAARWGDAPWVEFKWDGIRALGTWDGERLRLRARSGTDITARYPELSAADLGLGELALELDGEIVAMDAGGRPSFTRLQHRMHLTKPREIEREVVRTPVTLVLFDLLRIGDHDITSRPLSERRALLEQATAAVPDTVMLPPVTESIDDALATARSLALEGIVVKDPGSPYRRGQRSEQWLKVKLSRTHDVVIGGIRPGRGTRSGQIGSLLVGIPSGDGLRYVGRVGSGLSDADVTRLTAMLASHARASSPFIEVPSLDAADAIWVDPLLVAEVEFAEFSPSGRLRHPRWRGLRADMTPDDVRDEAPPIEQPPSD